VFNTNISPKYRKVHQASNKWIDFSKGKCIVNSISGNLSVENRNKLSEKAMKWLKNIGGSSISYIDDVRIDYILPNNIPFKAKAKHLNILKATTDFNYLMNITTFINNKGANDLRFYKKRSKLKMRGGVQIIVYSIETGQLLFNYRVSRYLGKRARARNKIPNNHFATNEQHVRNLEVGEALIMGTLEVLPNIFSRSIKLKISDCLKKAIKELEKYSVKQK
jgi:hypothetical protein